jgi:hypothetical protein
MPGQAGAEIEITASMIEAGVRIIRESGALDAPSSADARLVQRILEAALEALSGEPRSCEARLRARQTAIAISRYL